MKERTKQILRYVACGLGGLALGIGLLGGLSMCATSNKATSESVNTIYGSPKRATGTNSEGYTYYTFEIPAYASEAQSGYILVGIWNVNPSTYELTPYTGYTRTIPDSSNTTIRTLLQSLNDEYRPTDPNTYRFLRVSGYSNTDMAGLEHWAYMTFLESSNYGYGFKGFVLTNQEFIYTGNLYRSGYSHGGDSNPIILTAGDNPYFCLYDTNQLPEANFRFKFQDVQSYYKSLGYDDGYSTGHQEGYQEGYTDGYAEGYTNGADNSLLFTKIGANQTAWSRSDITWDDSTDTTSTMKCLDFKDGENNNYYVSLDDYTVGGGEVLINVYKNGTASNNLYATIGRGNYNTAYTEIEIIPASYLEFEFAQVTTYYHNAIPNNWFMLSGTPANANGYQQGYQAGYRDGQMSTPSGQATDNVFSLFTQAFNSVGGIFEMKIFGFLPLYWFFLTPIFIAIITLLLRMVKH